MTKLFDFVSSDGKSQDAVLEATLGLVNGLAQEAVVMAGAVTTQEGIEVFVHFDFPRTL